ncbi:TetR/AcrR family transcriptional regulator C-terminal domain-containing protein [Nocardia sp. NPDC088792]|uniref:TetR/AcrR family transcriptional regulator C-terminal domain-containing protein n=1 Tax=Nocardia sp. NPDC088792 TaxID=3364332 RepID=UPI0038053C67
MPAAGLDRDAIVRVALTQLDEVGLEALSLRRVAKDLGVHPSALYYHFTNKQELLDEMARAIIADALNLADAPHRQRWDDWLVFLARTQRRAVRTHRDGAILMFRSRPTAADQLAYLDTLIQLLITDGFTAEGAGRAFSAVSGYAIGIAAAEQQRANIALDPAVLEKIGAHSGFATIAEAAAAEDAAFEHGLHWLIEGMRAELAAAPSNSA